jgi:hypothetical protein
MHPLVKDSLRAVAHLVDPRCSVRNAARRIVARYDYRSSQVLDPAAGNRRLGEMVANGSAAAVGKIGMSELRVLRHFLRHRGGAARPYPAWLRREAVVGPGIFPAEDACLDRFCGVWLDALRQLDLLAVWYNRGESAIAAEYCPAAALCDLTALEPFYHPRPWSRELGGKRVLVVSPFAETIMRQYPRRAAIWRSSPSVLPDFDLTVLRCPLSPALVEPRHPDWFDALAALEVEMGRMAFDVALIGAGAFSIPLCAASRRRGRICIHMGGPLQILFGIKGGRWDRHAPVTRLYNEAWVRPAPLETPPGIDTVERGAYW